MRASQLAGAGVPPAAIINRCSAGGVQLPMFAVPSTMGMQQIASGSLTAGVLSTAINVTGRGEINAMVLQNAEAVARTQRAKLTIDGVVVFDATTNSAATSYSGLVIIGVAGSNSAPYFVMPEKVIFNKSFKLEIAASDTASNKLNVGVIYKTY